MPENSNRNRVNSYNFLREIPLQKAAEYCCIMLMALANPQITKKPDRYNNILDHCNYVRLVGELKLKTPQ